MTPSSKPLHKCNRIALWTGPRNVSTALMYAFAQRQDMQVVDEPYYGHYLHVTGAKHPGANDIMAAMDCDGNRVTQQVILGPCNKPNIFFKNMIHHMAGLTLNFLDSTTNILLTRDPTEMLPSHAKGLGYIQTLQETGYKTQVELLEQLTNQGQTVPVLDSGEILKNPKSVLRQLCRQINLPFDKAMLQWPAGPRPEDGVWARYWYHSVHQSTEFKPCTPPTAPFPPHLQPLLKECMPYYKKLLSHVIKA